MINIASTGIYNASNGATTAPIPKPTGLAVGDLMVAVISTVRSAITSAPTGWTVVNSNNLTYNFCTVYKKIADASDVSASTFSWSGSYAIGGIIYRIPEGDFNNIQMSLTAPLTPKTKDNAVILVGTSSDDDSDSCTFSGYSTTGGPAVTYTEGYDSLGTSSSYYGAMGVASGIHSSFDNITAFNVTADTTPDATSRFMILIGDIYTVNHSDLFKNCLAYYDFEGNSNDKSIHAYNGTDTNVTYSDVGGKQGKYSSFNGSSSKIQLPNILSELPTNYSISAFIKLNNVSVGGTIISDRAGASYFYRYRLEVAGDGTLTFYIYNGALTEVYSSVGAIKANTWYHIVATADISGNCCLYINGVQVASASYVANSYPAQTNNSTIGVLTGPAEGGWVNGYIDEIGIWNRVLSLSEIQLLYALPKQLHNGLISYWKLDGNSYDFVGKNDGQDNSVSYNTSYGKIGQGVRLDANGDYIKCGNKIQLGTSDFTISLWMRSTQAQEVNKYPMLFSIESPTTPRYNININNFNSNVNGAITVEMYSNGTGTGTFGIDVRDGNWHHIVVKKTSSKLSIYVDGHLIREQNHSLGAISNGTNVIYFGTFALAVGEQTYIGDLDEIGIWNRVLTGEEIQQLFYAGNGNTYPLQTNMADMM